MFLFYRLTGRRGKRWETERGGNDPVAKSSRKFNNKEKKQPSKGPDIERGRNSKNVQEGIWKDDLLYLAERARREKEPRGCHVK